MPTKICRLVVVPHPSPMHRGFRRPRKCLVFLERFPIHAGAKVRMFMTLYFPRMTFTSEVTKDNQLIYNCSLL